MIRVAIVEDDERYRQELQTYLQRYERESGQTIVVTCFTDGDEITQDYSARYDIVLMDIQMQFMDGMEAAKAIREVDSEVIIIFITNMPQYAMQGYTVDALDYVLKPISYYAFTQRMERAIERISKRRQRYVMVSVKNGVHKLDMSRITFIEVQDHDLVYHLTGYEQLHVRGTLSDVEKELAQGSFFRASKCYLVNLEHVEAVTGNDLQVGGETIQVSRARKKPLMDALNEYIQEVR